MYNLSKKYNLVFLHLAKNAGKSICNSLQIKKSKLQEFNQTTLLGDDIRKSYIDNKSSAFAWENLTKFTVVRNPWDRMVSLYHFRKQENDLLMRKHESWEPIKGDSSQEDWSFKKWLLNDEVKLSTADINSAKSEKYKNNFKIYVGPEINENGNMGYRIKELPFNSINVFTNYKILLANALNGLDNQKRGRKLNPGELKSYFNWFRSRIEFLNQIDIITNPHGSLYVDYIIEYNNLEKEFNNMCSDLRINPPKLPVINKSKHKNYREYYDEETKNYIYKLFKKDINYFGYEF
tara:strand:- start:125 stop:1000 length:876 start_codon:yes stop_codon:yes gene_type:complete